MDEMLEASEPPEDASSVLEQFRQKWREEVRSRVKQDTKRPEQGKSTVPNRRLSANKPERPINKPPVRHSHADARDDYDEPSSTKPAATSHLHHRLEDLDLREADEDDFSSRGPTTEPQTALEHFEHAVEKERQGNLGDSVAHYRKAYKLDDNVDQTYRKKHFPSKPKPTQPSRFDVIANTRRPEPNDAPSEAPLSFKDLILSYSDLQIPNADPIVEGDEPPPCYIRRLPTEVLIELLRHVAIRDPAAFVKVALVCKRLAFRVFSETAIWKRIALGNEFGLAGQQYQFATDLQGREAIFRTLEESDEDELPPVNESIFSQNTDWKDIFQNHPRIRFTGVYISTVNYTRSGGASATLATWTSTVHIVTYYRYLRFFRDGTCISLLTVSEPIDVVPHLTKETMNLIRPTKDTLKPSSTKPNTTSSNQKDTDKLPPSVRDYMKHALRGRWRLCHPSCTDPFSGPEIGANTGVAGDLHIETEGAGPRYVYTLHLALKSSSRSKHTAKNNKLVWKGFWSHNTLADDWAEFHLRNDKAFYFSRVKSYGLGY